MGIRRELGPLCGRLHQKDLCGRSEVSEPAGELPDWTPAGHQHRPPRELAGEFHCPQCGSRGFDPGRLESSQTVGDPAQVPWEGGHQRCQRSIGLQTQRRLQSALPTEVRPPGPAVVACAVHVAVGVDRDPLAAAHSATSLPTAATRPVDSCPRTQSPRYTCGSWDACRSLPQIPQRSTSTRT